MGTHPIFESDFDCLTEMGDFMSKMTATAEPTSNIAEQQPKAASYSTPQKKIELADPRSPTQHLDRTPVVIKNDAKLVDDPRSPMASVNRTPIAVATSSNNEHHDLRKKVLMSQQQCLSDDENISKRISFD